MRKLTTPFLALAAFLVFSSYAEAISISGQSINPTTISYETQGASVTTVSFSLDTPADVTVAITNINTGVQVAQIDQNFATSGAKSIIWDALWLIGNDLGRTNDNFQFTIAATTGSASDVKTVLTPLLIRSVDIHNVSVSPSFDASRNPTFPYLVNYQLAKDAQVTITVLNSSGSVVRTLLNGKLQLGESTVSTHTVTWNGLGDDGRPVPLGIYTVTLDALDPSNNDRAIQRTRNFAVASLAGANSDPQTLFEQNVFVYPNPIRNAQGIFQFAAVRDGARITLKIYTIAGDLVRDEVFTNLTAGNINSFTWNTTNESGNRVGRGLYFYVVREEDPQGTLQTTKKLVVLP